MKIRRYFRAPIPYESPVRRSFHGAMFHFLREKINKTLFLTNGIPVILFSFGATEAKAETLSIATFTALAQRCGANVAPLTLAAIAKTESRFETLVVADNTTRSSRTYQSIDRAASIANQLIAKGHSVDIGLMQINSNNFKWLGMTARDALDPCKAIRAGAKILTGNFMASRKARTQQIALRNALSMYNTGNATYGYKNGYVRKVENAANSLAMNFSSSPAAAIAISVNSDQVDQVDEAPTRSGPWDVWNGGGRPHSGELAQNSDNIYIF